MPSGGFHSNIGLGGIAVVSVISELLFFCIGIDVNEYTAGGVTVKRRKRRRRRITDPLCLMLLYVL